MAKWEFLVIAVFAVFVSCTDVDDVEHKKRGVAKGSSLNSITTGAQKQDYTYSIYSQNPSSQSQTSSSYQSQVPNSFYPNQGSQYYSSSNTQTEASPTYTSQHQSSTSHFVPLNFVPNPGYQSKYQIVPAKPNGVQLAIVQQPGSYQNPPIVPYSPSLFSSNSNHVNSHQNPLLPSPSQGHFNVASNYQPFGGSYLSQPSTMLLFAPPNPSLYNNFLYPNPSHNFYNYYPSNSQSKYNGPYASGSAEYEKFQGSISQSIPKDDNDIAHNSEYATPSDSYKNAYTASRNPYSKL